MKRVIIVALAVVASASSFTANAAKKKVQKKQTAEVVEAIRLTNATDSVSYAAGMTLTNGLLPYLLQQGIDTAYMADFVQGFKEFIKSDGNAKFKAYATGMEIANQVQNRLLPGMRKEFEDTPDSIVTRLFYEGFTGALQGDTTVMKTATAETFFRERQEADKLAKDEKLYGANRRAGEAFLRENAKKDSVVVTPSGLQYKILVKGEGEVAQSNEKVLVNYEGRLIDGTVFDASSRHGDKPASFLPAQVIKGWTEALTMMPVGSKWQLYIPQELAYGSREAGQIKPYSALIFDVEVVGIDRPEEAKTEADKADTKTKAKTSKSKNTKKSK